MLIVESLIIWILLLTLAYGLGVRVAQWLRLTFTSLLDVAAFAIGLGFGCMIGVGFALGVVGWLTPPIVLAALCGLAFISISSIHLTRLLIIRPPKQTLSFPTSSFVRYTGRFFLAALIAINLVGALAPDVIWDAHSYHLNLPRLWLNAERFVHVPYIFYSTWPLNLSILYAVEMSLVPDSVLPQLTHFTLGVLSMLLIYNYLRPRYMGVQRTPLDYLLLPLRLLIPQHNPYEGPISWLFLAGVLWGFLQRRNRAVLYLTLYAVITFGLWMFYTTQQIRMLLPTLGAVSIVLGIGLSRLAFRLRWGRLVVAAVMLLIIGEGSINAWRERSPILADQFGVVAGAVSREAYLRAHLEPADMLLFANRNLPPGGAILSMQEVRSFLSDHEVIWGVPSLQAYIDFSRLQDPQALRQRLSDVGIQYILLTGPTPALEALRREMQLIYKSGKYSLYRWEPNRRWKSDECYVATSRQDYCLIPGAPQAILGEIVPGTKLFQTFTSECTGLNRIKLFLTTYDRMNTNTLQLRLKDMDAEQQLFDIAIPAAEIANNQWHEISFEPLLDSKARHYRITLAAPAAEPGNAFGIWHTGKDTYPDGEALINNDPIQADFVFQYGCGQ